MTQREKTALFLLIILLLISLTGNILLFLRANRKANLATERQVEIEMLRQEVDELRQELKSIRAEAQNKILIQETMDLVAGQTESLRHLDSQSIVTRSLVNREEIGQVISRKLAAEYAPQDAHRDEVVLATLDLIPPDLDIYAMIENLLGEQVAGLYDPTDETFYIASYGGKLGAFEKVTFAHEYTHALQDQYFDLEALGVGNKQKNQNDDQLLALHALIEGDATLSMQQYMATHFTALDMLGLAGTAITIDQTVLNQAPAYFRKSLMFPYQDGLIFASYLYQQRGWSAVDDAFKDLPQSSEQILHPPRYPNDIPQIVTIPPLSATLGSDWQLVSENVLGEFSLRLYLDVHLTQGQSARAAEGWGGDRYAVYQNKTTEQVVLIIKLLWDDEAERDEFIALYQQYAQLRFGTEAQQVEKAQTWWSGEDVLLLTQNDNQSEAVSTLIVLTPNMTITEQVLAAFEQ